MTGEDAPVPSLGAADERWLRRALRLAERGRYRTAPNPLVGAVAVRGGNAVGEGWHRRLGGPHAEVEALRAAGAEARGATLYVSLEPCRHQGRTPPCTDAILAAGVRRVVACHRDPSPAAGGGFEQLRAAGLEVEVGGLAEEAVRLNLAYLIPALRRRPAVTLKWAMSLDGKIATSAGESQWISSPAARRWALALREEHDAVLVGIGTVLADDPGLERRLGRAAGPHLRAVLDRRLRTPPEARLFAVPGEVVVYTESVAEGRRRRLERAGATVVGLPEVTPEAVLSDLYGRGVHSLLVEGGAGVLAAFAREKAFDRVAVACAPLLIGGSGAPGPLGGMGFPHLPQAPRLEHLRAGRRGMDLILTAFRQGCSRELSSNVAG